MAAAGHRASAGQEEKEAKGGGGEAKECCVSRTEYYGRMDEYYATKSERRLWTREQITRIIDELKMAKEIETTKTSRQYWLLKKYDVLEVDGVSSLIIKRSSADDALVQIVPYEDIYDKLADIHVARTRHLGRDKIASVLTSKCYYIPRPPIHIFIECCNVCNRNKTMKRNVLVIHSSAPAPPPPLPDSVAPFGADAAALDADPAREEFHVKLDEYYVEKKNRRPYTRSEVQQMISELRQVRELRSKRKSSHQYWLMKKYALLEAEGTTHVIIKPKGEGEPLVHVVPYEDLFDRLREVHVKTGHGGRDRMVSALAEKRYHIARPAIVFFIETCRSCNRPDGGGGKRDRRLAGPPAKLPVPVSGDDFNLRGQLDLMDMRPYPDGDFRWLLVYQDMATKMVALRPLRDNGAPEVAAELLRLFLAQGPPQALQSNGGKELVADVLEELWAAWPECRITNAHARPVKGRGAVKRASHDVERMLRTWMQENDSRAWARGCHFVQWRRNTSKHRLLGRSPYQVVYGHEPKGGMPPSASPAPEPQRSLPKPQAENTEEQLVSVAQSTGADYQLAASTSAPQDAGRAAYPTGQELFSSIGLEQIVCCVCGNQAAGSPRCGRCNKYVHAVCGQTFEEGYGKGVTVLCYHCQNQEVIPPVHQQYLGQKRPMDAMMMQPPPKKPPFNVAADCSGYIMYH